MDSMLPELPSHDIKPVVTSDGKTRITTDTITGGTRTTDTRTINFDTELAEYRFLDDTLDLTYRGTTTVIELELVQYKNMKNLQICHPARRTNLSSFYFYLKANVIILFYIE